MNDLPISMEINGESFEGRVAPRVTLADFLRQELELTGTHIGCEMGFCGACLVLLDDQPVHSCLIFAVQAEGCKVETIEGLTARQAIADVQKAFHERNALQCGFCTPGMLVSAYDMLASGRPLKREEIREALSGNYCRCTGYEAIVDAIEETAKHRSSASGKGKSQR